MCNTPPPMENVKLQPSAAPWRTGTGVVRIHNVVGWGIRVWVSWKPRECVTFPVSQDPNQEFLKAHVLNLTCP